MRKGGIISLIIYFALCLLVVFIYQMGPPEVWNQQFRVAWGKLTSSQDQQRICHALNRYFEAHGEYPPYLLGGEAHPAEEEYGLSMFKAQWADSEMYGKAAREALVRAQTIKEQLSDPLLAGGYLRQYPRWAYFWDRYEPPLIPDPRGLRRMRNVVSAPNDPVVEYYRSLASPILEKRLAYELIDGEFRESINPGQPYIYLAQQGLLQTDLKRSRYFCAGAYEWAWWNDREFYKASVFVGSVVYTLSLVAGSSIRHNDNTVSGQFGYQRGDFIEFIDGTARDAWLWFYGFVSGGDSPEEMPGLDLVDNDDGLIRPDGIPDGICILYELRDGEVVNVTRAEDM